MRITATIDELCAFSEQFILKMGISFLKRQNFASPNTWANDIMSQKR